MASKMDHPWPAVLFSLWVLTSALEFAKHGASALILHYFGDEATEGEIQSLQREIEMSHVRSV